MTKLNRMKFLGHILASGVVYFSGTALIAGSEDTIAIGAAVCFGAIVWQIWAMLGRLTDLNTTRWAALILIVPIANIVMFIWLFFARGYDDKHGVAVA